ncbi:beclin-1 isoform X1 [Arapaima gigas]
MRRPGDVDETVADQRQRRERLVAPGTCTRAARMAMEGSKSSSSTMQVSFVCQRCSQPLKLDTSFNVLDRVTIQELIAPLVTVTQGKQMESNEEESATQETFAENKQDGVARKYIPPARMMSTESANSFTLIGEASDGGTMENLSRRLKVTSDLFDIMSGQTDVDHPLCEECTDTLLDHLDTQLNITENECQNYKKCLELLSQLREEEEDTLLAELRQLKEEEESLIQQLEAIEGQREAVAKDLAQSRKHTQQLDGEELQHQKEYSEFKRQQLELDDELKSADNQMRYAQIQLDRLKKTNVFNATFHIWHSGQFGTINNFRLGRLPSVPVEWHEINAAWGQTVLLLHALANKMGLRFERYRLVPYGNHSYLESLSDKSKLFLTAKEMPLYCSGGLRFFWDNKFDHAMVAFLDCKGKIEDTGGSGGSYSIKTQFNSEEQWTKALKFMLTNLKWGLAWVSSQFYNK